MRTALVTLASLLALAVPVAAQTTGPLELYWSSIDAGGTTSTSQDGSTYEVFGVIGQPDANVHSGGGFTLYGGFLNSDPGSAFAISDVSQLEGSGGLTTFTFTITRTGETSGEGSVEVSTVDGTATAPADYAGFSGQVVSFAVGQSQATVSVEVVADTVVEGDETFGVVLSNPSDGAFLGDDTGVGTILNDDSATVAIGDVVLDEGDTGTTSFSFTVTLTGAVQGGFTVPFSTSDGTAAAPGDYATTSDTLTFAGADGETQVATVLVVGDEVVEPNEDFTVTLGVPSHADVTAADDTGRGTIQNDDGATLTIDDVTQAEGDAGTTAFTFTALLTGAVQGGFTVPVATTDGSAIAPGDYVALSDTLTFAGSDGETQVATVQVVGDDVVELDETFTVTFGAPSTADVVADDAGLGTIWNDEATVAIADVTRAEGDSGSTGFEFTVTLSGDIHAGFTVPFLTASGTATDPGDFVVTADTLAFAGADGEVQTATVQVWGDQVVEVDETFTVVLGTPSDPDVTAADDTGLGTVENDDSATLTIADVTQAEGDAGTTAFNFAVTLAGDVQGGFSVPVATADGTALAPGDYLTTSDTLLFAGTDGEIQTFPVPVVGNEVVEPDETFSASLGSPSHADVTVVDGVGAGVIANDDGAARLEVTKVVAHQDPVNDTVSFTLVIVNVGDEPQTDDPASDELEDVLPTELALLSAVSDSATFLVVADPGTNTVIGNGTIPAGAMVTVTIDASVLVPPGSEVTNQAVVRFDADHDGVNESMGPSDDPSTAIPGDGTTFLVEGTILEIPTLGPWALVLLILALALAALTHQRGRPQRGTRSRRSRFGG